MTGPGTLNRRLTLEEPVETDDGAGGVTRDYQTLATLWAEVTPVTARGDVVAAALGATVTHRIVIRRNPDVTTRHRFRDGARIFRIVSMRERQNGRFLEIQTEERTS
jgi:SPP1 family predicted phage head-tail adaptor